MGRAKVLRKCVVCDSEFMAIVNDINYGNGRCCSRRCAGSLASVNRNQQGPQNNNWKGGGLVLRRQQRYRQNHPEKYLAKLLTRKGLTSGKLTRQPCIKCGSEKSQAHHHDYSKPLDVIWLCPKHHVEIHGGRFGKADAYQRIYRKSDEVGS